ncbi:MAG: hypothetical protein HYV60_14300 [Planctomycetia bacterium]|nr:hypothetical protein [Planctomycetia bacterium]
MAGYEVYVVIRTSNGKYTAATYESYKQWGEGEGNTKVAEFRTWEEADNYARKMNG